MERGDAIDCVNEFVTDEPRTSVRRLSNELDLPKSTVHKILNEDLGLRAFKPTNVQFLSDDDMQCRTDACRGILEAYPIESQFVSVFFFSLTNVQFIHQEESEIVFSGQRKILIPMKRSRSTLLQ